MFTTANNCCIKMAEESDFKFFNLSDTPRKKSFQEHKILLKIPSITTPMQNIVQEGAEDGILLAVPTLSRHRNSVFITPEKRLSVSQQGSLNSLENIDGDNNNDENGTMTNQETMNDIALRNRKKQADPVTLQAASYEDFLAFEQEYYGSCDKLTETHVDSLGGGDSKKGCSQKIKEVFSKAGECCFCRLPGTKRDEYLAQGKTCYGCCLMQVILIILHIPVYTMTVLSMLREFCRSQKPCNKSGHHTGEDDITDEKDLIEIQDFDYFWPPRDITADEIDKYKSTVSPVMKQWHDHQSEASLELIKLEFQQMCKSNFIERFRVLVGMINDNDRENLKHLGIELARTAAINGYIEIVKLLIACMNSEVKLAQTTNNYFEISVFHIAIINRHHELVDIILDKFTPEDQYSLLHTHASKSVSKWFASVELPLNLAVWIGDELILENLVKRGGELCEQDSKGNNVFHTVVLMSAENPILACKIFDKLVELIAVWVKITKKFTFFRNMSAKSAHIVAMEMLLHAHDKDEFTPLQVAAKLGVYGIMNKLLSVNDVYKFAYRSLGPESRLMYDMTEIDPFLMQNEKTASVLELLVMRYSDKPLQCLELPPITQLIEGKCDHYWSFISTNAIFHFSFMVIYNASAYKELFPTFIEAANQTDSDKGFITNRYKLGLIDWFILLFSLLYLMYALFACSVVWKVMKKVKATSSDKLWLTNTLQLQTLLMFSLSAIFYVILKAVRFGNEVYALAFSMLCGWLHMILYTRGFKATAFFAIMVHKVLFGDVLRFLCVIMILVLGYSMATSAIAYTINGASTLTDPTAVMISYLKLAIGISDFGPVSQSENLVTVVLYITFIVLANVLLFNLLIAAMSTTFSKISEQRDLMCQKVRISDIIVLEQMLPLWLQRGVLTMYKHRWVKVYMPGGTILKKEMFLIVSKQQQETE